MPASARLFRVFGISIGVHWTWLIIFLLLTVTLALNFFPSIAPGLSPAAFWILGATAAILLFAAVLVHELAHSLVAQAHGQRVNSITLFMFGGVSNIQEQARQPGHEFVMSIVGPITSIVIGGLFLLVAGALQGTSAALFALAQYLAVVNILIGLFNLIPGFPLDGGRVLRSIVWAVTNSREQATRIAALVGMGVAWIFIVGGLFLAFAAGNVIGGIWIALIGWFLNQAAGVRYQRATQQEQEAGSRG